MKIADVSKYLTDEEAATDLIESIRWASGRVCPFCGYARSFRLNVKGIKRRRYKCSGCRKQFTVSVGTIFEDSHIPFGKWIYVIYQMCIAKKGVSAKQLQRELGIAYRSAWFMCHRVRYAMTQTPLAEMLSGVVEADEAYIGGKEKNKHKGKRDSRNIGGMGKQAVLSLVERGGKARSFVVPDIKTGTLHALAVANIDGTAHVMTDSMSAYRHLSRNFASHQAVNHSKEFVRGIIHVNFAESYFSLLKRGIIGTFHHISKRHMQRYLNEFDFRWNHRRQNPSSAFNNVVLGSAGKRLMFAPPKEPTREKAKETRTTGD